MTSVRKPTWFSERQKWRCRMVVSFSSIKGGTGKTSICIHVANYCAAAGYRVLVIDFDVQNSLSFYYLDELSVTERKEPCACAEHEGSGRQYRSIQLLWHRYSGLVLLANKSEDYRGEHAQTNDRRGKAWL